MAFCANCGNQLPPAVNFFAKCGTPVVGVSAEQGFADAQYNLGICYEYGQGVKQDYAKAKEWFSKAATQ